MKVNGIVRVARHRRPKRPNATPAPAKRRPSAGPPPTGPLIPPRPAAVPGEHQVPPTADRRRRRRTRTVQRCGRRRTPGKGRRSRPGTAGREATRATGRRVPGGGDRACRRATDRSPRRRCRVRGRTGPGIARGHGFGARPRWGAGSAGTRPAMGRECRRSLRCRRRRQSSMASASASAPGGTTLLATASSPIGPDRCSERRAPGGCRRRVVTGTTHGLALTGCLRFPVRFRRPAAASGYV